MRSYMTSGGQLKTIVTGEHGLETRLKFSGTRISVGLCLYIRLWSSSRACTIELLSNISALNVFFSIVEVNDKVELVLLVILVKRQ